MIFKLKKTIKSIIFCLYSFVFNQLPGEFTKRLIKNLSFAFFGIGGATLITFGFNVLAIRYLGPNEYGKLSLIISVGEFLVIFMLWGLASSCLRYLGAERKNWNKIIGSSFCAVVFLGLIFSSIFLFLKPYLEDILKIPSSFYNFALYYALIAAFFYLFQSFFQGLEKFKKLSFLLLGSSLIFVILVLFELFYLKNFSFQTLFWPNIFRYLMIIIVGLIIFKKALLKFNFQTFKKLFHYGTFQMLSVFAGFFSLGNMDNLMINYFLGPTAVGLYAAYYMSFNVFVTKILNTFSQVFLPMASGYKDVKELFSRWLIFIKKTFFLILAGNVFLIWLVFQFYGKAFVFDWRLAFLMALNVALYGFLMILGNIILSVGIHGAKVGIVFAFLSAIINVILNFVLIPHFKLFGTMAASLISILTIMILAIWFIKIRLIKNDQI